MVLRSAGDRRPRVGPDVYVDESAVVIGDVDLQDRSSVWPGAVLRADDDRMEIGRGSAVMDVAFLEAPKGRPVVVGDSCIISHGARLHGCQVGSECLIGIGAILLDGVTLGERSVVAAGSLLPPGTRIPPESFVMGSPGKVTRNTSQADQKWLREELQMLREKAARYSRQAASGGI
ncbi:MAG: gamma carbonic anhydrase family protein [Thermoplasmata archaeon]|nr:gamma carbonic anhydrase family protein [Thermoplasmata archaeon]